MRPFPAPCFRRLGLRFCNANITWKLSRFDRQGVYLNLSHPVKDEALDTHNKALKINLDPRWYGTFAEIGAGQEVVRWFFRVGGAAGTIAKSISAYDMKVSDAIYGHASAMSRASDCRQCSTGNSNSMWSGWEGARRHHLVLRLRRYRGRAQLQGRQ